MVKAEQLINIKNPWIQIYTVVLTFIGVLTCFYLKKQLILPYVACMLVFYLNIVVSLDSISKNLSSKFFHVFSVLLTLGFPIKFSAHTIWDYGYLEPIGRFDNSIKSFSSVLIVATCGGIGILIAQLVQRRFQIGKISDNHINMNEKSKVISYLFILLLGTSLAAINLNYNILLFGLTPSVKLPMSGNAIFFLAMTRGILFLIFFKIIENISFKWTFLSSIIVLIISVGVLSRMLMIMFFVTIFINFLKTNENVNIKKFIQYSFLLLVMSFICVKLATGMRMKLYEATKAVSRDKNREIASKITDRFTSYIGSYRNMVIDRWIGMEGVMAVEGYDGKGYGLFTDALLEKSYKGNSFYTKIADEKNYNDLKTKSGKIVTSVPGPIAYFYYSGSKTFVFFMMFLSTLLITNIEAFFSKKIVQENVSNFIAIFMVFDYFQFGIAPISMIKNWAFTFIILLLFINIKKITYIILKSYKHKF